MNVVYIGEIVGKTGVFALKSVLPEIRRTYSPDFIIADADSATGGAGLGVQHAVYLRKLGVDCLCVGECAYYKIDMTEFFPRAGWVLRPANLPYENPGRGYKVFQAAAGKLAVVTILGQAGFPRIHADNPFLAISQIVERLKRDTDNIVVDFHAATTAEKITMATYMDGKVSAIIGSHCKALTADARVSEKGTANITDSGRTGSLLSVGGMDPDAKVREFMTAVRSFNGDGTLGLEVQGCAVQIGAEGRAESMEAFRIPCREKIQ